MEKQRFKCPLILLVGLLGGCQPIAPQTPLSIDIASDGTTAHAIAYDSDFLTPDCDGSNRFLVCVGETCVLLPARNGGATTGCGEYVYEGDVPLAADNGSYSVSWNSKEVLTVIQPPSFVAPPTPTAPVSRSTPFSFDWAASPSTTATWSDPPADCLTDWDFDTQSAAGGHVDVLPSEWTTTGDVDVTLCLNQTVSGTALPGAAAGSHATATQTRSFVVHTTP